MPLAFRKRYSNLKSHREASTLKCAPRSTETRITKTRRSRRNTKKCIGKRIQSA